MYDEESLRSEQSGSTAITVVIKNNSLYCANIGDSRAIASINHTLEKLSWDHKPNNEKEYERITDAGGWVDCNRVNGNLALSRAFGDYIFKKNGSRRPEEQIVTAFPDIVEKKISPEWDFLVLACDGIWDVMSDEDVLNYVTENIANGMEPEEICETLMMRCLAPDCQMAGLGCDNMTVVIVVFLHGETYEQVIEKCKNYIADRKIEKEEQEVSELISSPAELQVTPSPEISTVPEQEGENTGQEQTNTGQESKNTEQEAEQKQKDETQPRKSCSKKKCPSNLKSE